MLWCGQRVLAGNVKFIKANIMQEHIDAAEVVGCDVDFLTEEAVAHSVPAKNFFCLQKQRTGTVRRINVPADFDTVEKALSGVKTAEKGLK